MLSYRKYELDEARDAWAGVGWRDVPGKRAGSIGRQLEGSATWTAIPGRLTVEAGISFTRRPAPRSAAIRATSTP